jgi:L-asparagine transporter-like permease
MYSVNLGPFTSRVVNSSIKTIYISAELKNPTKQLPLTVNTAIPTIVLCYVAANAAYYILLPWKVVSTTDSIAVVSVNYQRLARSITNTTV